MKDHISILIAFLSALGCYTAVSILGADGSTVLHDVLVALVGGLVGVAWPRSGSDKPE